uniref:Uncharacterized protein n=1 Tax=Siphoviridae sp. ct2vX3 TaxID=2825318 RepID=A0A8S5PYH4_9CAUD|nr:MAG TPA: hypothetical protein [Siphoviridae sp. ct2vX3]
MNLLKILLLFRIIKHNLKIYFRELLARLRVYNMLLESMLKPQT